MKRKEMTVNIRGRIVSYGYGVVYTILYNI